MKLQGAVCTNKNPHVLYLLVSLVKEMKRYIIIIILKLTNN